MTERSIHCTFHHVSADLAPIISSSLSIRSLSKGRDDQYTYTCSLSIARQIRSKLADSLGDYPHIWLSLDHVNHASSSLPSEPNPLDHLYFGSLLSSAKFLIHSTPLNERPRWTIRIDAKQTLIVQSDQEQLLVPFKFLHKEVLVIDSEDFTEMIFSYHTICIEARGSTKLYGNHPLVESLTRCSDLLICFASKSRSDAFLDHLQTAHQFKVFYTALTIQSSAYHWSPSEFDSYPSDSTRYAVSLLHSLGYKFDDKYLSNRALQSQMRKLAAENDEGFYQLSIRAYIDLKKCHWLDLTRIFHPTAARAFSNEPNLCSVSVVHVTPTRLLVLPKEKTKGHRAMRHSLFRGIDDFCLVYIKPDPPNVYLNDNRDQLEYFREIFETGIDLSGWKYHLFGSSNSQLKEHSYWFIKASSLDDIHRKRQTLGQLDQIRNVGTYVARLGLWFSKTDPTNIRLTYCASEHEFNARVQRGETCVTIVNDVERNGYCFTDGNGLVSKGLAKLIQDSQEKLVSMPSAYQIRMAGCKGLIIVDPHSTFEQFYIKIRPSMKKFECDHWILDICGFSRATPSRLNNQFIWLLSDLGVSDTTLLRLQQRWFSKKPSRTVFPDDILKNKIPLPANECRYIYGCALESTLEEGQCFLRYEVLNSYGKSLSPRQFDCVRGRIIVTKNPCPYAGDMLELWAVDLPELHHLNDVIVFSVRGERPDFNKIAGSDLDGDGYFVYWGEELRLKCQVPPLDYTPDEKQYQSTPIGPTDVIRYCLSTLSATNSGEIYNLHAIIVDKNEQNHAQRTCQPLAIELARMFSSSVDSGKTGYVIDKKRIEELRRQHGRKFPDFLGKDKKRSYPSTSIVGKLYQNALYYINGKTTELDMIFAQLNLNGDEDDRLNLSLTKRTELPAKASAASVDLHPGSPLSPTPSPVPTDNDSTTSFLQKIPPQHLLIEGMSTTSTHIQLIPSTKPFYSEHSDLTRLQIELRPSTSTQSKSISPSLSALLFDQITSYGFSIGAHESSVMVISFGHLYLLKYPDQINSTTNSPQTLDSLQQHHFLPPLFDTFLPSTILERIEITASNAHCLQQIFFKSNHSIRREYVEPDCETLRLVFPWFKMTFTNHRREILLLCWNTLSSREICVHFDKNGRIQSTRYLPRVLFKCFHQQNASYRPDILYELRSSASIDAPAISSIFKHQTLLDPTHPLTLPFQENIVPIVSYSTISNVFQHDDVEVHIQRIFSPIHYKNDDFYQLRCVLGYIEQAEQQQSIAIHVPVSKSAELNRDRVRYIVALAVELSQMLE